MDSFWIETSDRKGSCKHPVSADLFVPVDPPRRVWAAGADMGREYSEQHQRVPLGGSESVLSTLSSEKLPTAWLGGNSLNDCRNCPTYACAP